MKAITLNFLQLLLPVWFNTKPKTITPQPKEGWYGLNEAIIDPLSFISEHFGDMYSIFTVVGLKDHSKDYALHPWLDLCEYFMKEKGFITGKQIIFIGVDSGYLEVNYSVNANTPKTMLGTVITGHNCRDKHSLINRYASYCFENIYNH